jgi:hypothetical protein
MTDFFYSSTERQFIEPQPVARNEKHRQRGEEGNEPEKV